MFRIKRFFEVEKNDTNFSVVHLQIREVLFEGFPWIDVTWVISSAFPFLSGLAKWVSVFGFTNDYLVLFSPCLFDGRITSCLHIAFQRCMFTLIGLLYAWFF